MKIDHKAETLLGIIYRTEEQIKEEAMENFHMIREGKSLNDEQLAVSLIHTVAAYNGHSLLILPTLATIYGMGTKELTAVSNQEFSYQLEAIVKYADSDLRDMITNTYFYTVLENETDNEI